MVPSPEAADAMVALWRDVTQRRHEALQVRQEAEELRRKLQSAEVSTGGSGEDLVGKTSWKFVWNCDK